MSEHEQIRPSAHQKKAKSVNTIIIINIIVFILIFWVAQNLDARLFRQLFNILALHHPISPLFQWHQLITHMFMHGGYFHIFINMFILWMFGTVLETIWTTGRFLVYYFLTGLGAAALHLAVNTIDLNNIQNDANAYIQAPSYEEFMQFKAEYINSVPPRLANDADQLAGRWAASRSSRAYLEESIELVQRYKQDYINTPTVGASGAIYGLLLAFGMLFPNARIYLYFLFPIKAKYFVIGLGLIELYSGLFGQNVGIANFAHLGGMIFGFFLIKFWGDKAKPRPRQLEAFDVGDRNY